MKALATQDKPHHLCIVFQAVQNPMIYTPAIQTQVVDSSELNLSCALPQMIIVCEYGGADGRDPILPVLLLPSCCGEP